jgi:protein-disulfide isomerase
VHLTRFGRMPVPAWVTSLLLLSVAACRGSEAKSAAGSPADTPTVAAMPPAVEKPVTADERVQVADRSRIMGDSSAKVWVIIVSDFQCPFCKTWHDSTAPKLKKEFVETGIARLAYVHFPLEQHQGAMPAAEASMCAGAQGKFWEFHDKLFATQHEWQVNPAPARVFAEYAKELGLNQLLYKMCIDAHVMVPMIEADVEKSRKSGTSSTPTFLVAGQSFSGAQPIETFRKAIAQALASTQ